MLHIRKLALFSVALLGFSALTECQPKPKMVVTSEAADAEYIVQTEQPVTQGRVGLVGLLGMFALAVLFAALAAKLPTIITISSMGFLVPILNAGLIILSIAFFIATAVQATAQSLAFATTQQKAVAVKQVS